MSNTSIVVDTGLAYLHSLLKLLSILKYLLNKHIACIYRLYIRQETKYE